MNNTVLFQDLARAIGVLPATANLRQRWDALWDCGFDVNRLYQAGLDDGQIDTMLRRIATMPRYEVRKARGLWEVARLDQPCHVGRVKTRKEALAIARLLAGWRGSVSLARAPKQGG